MGRMQLYLKTSTLIRGFADDNTHRNPLHIPVRSEILSCPFCFDYGVNVKL